jgi:hypothetical protein
MNWSYKNMHVQTEIEDSNFVSSESSLIAGGPPDWTGNVMSVVPMGVVDSYAVTTRVLINQVFEIGSRLFYVVHGRSYGDITINRVFYNGPSLLSVLYGAYTYTINGDSSTTIDSIAQSVTSSGAPTGMKSTDLNISGTIAPGTPLDKGFFGFNLASELFQRPTGILLFFEDGSGNPVGGVYLEHCYVNGHQFTNASANLIVGEGVNLTYVMQTPIMFVNNSAMQKSPTAKPTLTFSKQETTQS